MPDKKATRKLLDIQRVFNPYKRNFNFVSPEHLHVHIQMLGSNLQPESIERILTNLPGKAANTESPIFKFDRLTFGKPSQKIPNSISIEQKSNSELKKFTREIHFFVQGLDIPDIITKKDQTRAIHNITIAYTKKSMYKRFTHDIRDFIKQKDFPEVEWKPQELLLLSKQFAFNSSKLNIIERFKLKI